ncbi:MAG TPA: response regulator [Bacteroidota bacterium]|nr:response regulator [Bacteroidota bacterium]
MLIEDNEDHARIFRWALSQSKTTNQLTIFQSGEAGFEFLQQQAQNPDTAPDLVFLDFNLPKVDGREILQKIKSNDLTKIFPVIVLSSSERDEDVSIAYQLGASSFISKSVLLDDLSHVLETIQHYWTNIAKLPQRK